VHPDRQLVHERILPQVNEPLTRRFISHCTSLRSMQAQIQERAANWFLLPHKHRIGCLFFIPVVARKVERQPERSVFSEIII
jgi:hypothetical protein